MPPNDINTQYQTGEIEAEDLQAINNKANDNANLYHE